MQNYCRNPEQNLEAYRRHPDGINRLTREVLAMNSKGRPVAEIAGYFGVPVTFVNTTLIQAGRAKP